MLPGLRLQAQPALHPLSPRSHAGRLAVLSTAAPDSVRTNTNTKPPQKSRSNARLAYDPESHLDRLLGRVPSRATPFETAPGSSLPSTSITLTLLDTANAAPLPPASGRPVLSAVASIPITTSALSQVSQQAPSAPAPHSLSANPRPETAIALASFPYGERDSTAQQRGSASGSASGASPEGHAVLAVTSHGRALVWDTGSREVRSALCTLRLDHPTTANLPHSPARPVAFGDFVCGRGSVARRSLA